MNSIRRRVFVTRFRMEWEAGARFLCGGNGCPLEKGGMPMYVTYENLVQIGLFLVALIGLVYEISHKKKDKK